MKTILKVTGTVNSCRLKDHNHSNKKKQQQQVENNVNYLGTVNSCNPKRSVTQSVAFSCSTEQNFLHLKKIQNTKTSSKHQTTNQNPNPIICHDTNMKYKYRNIKIKGTQARACEIGNKIFIDIKPITRQQELLQQLPTVAYF